ncbi:MAG: hypothetical protein ABIN48_05300 [Ginsengibacter sp.]
MKRKLILLLLILTNISFAYSNIVVVSNSDNNIKELLSRNNIEHLHFYDYKKAKKKLKRGDTFLLLDTKQNQAHGISFSELSKILKKGVRVYLEAPYFISDLSDGVSQKVILERAVLNTSKIKGLDSLSILSLNDHEYYNYSQSNPIMQLAKVAGFDKADYGFTGTTVHPLLFKSNGVLISSSKLSDLFTSRLGPRESWEKVWGFILQSSAIDHIDWKLAKISLGPSMGKNEKVQAKDFHNAINWGSEWYMKSRLLIHQDWEESVQKYTKKNGEGVTFPPVKESSPIGDGRLGILEGHASFINKDGSQPIRWWIRADCQAETAFALSSSADYLNNPHLKEVAKNLLDYLYKKSNLRSGERADPKSPSFGLIGWATTDPDAYYGDDNARVLLGTIGASSKLGMHDWDSYIIEGILGNFRTAGKNGFRGPWFRDAQMQKTTWQALSDRTIVNPHPHYESWLWAMYVWLYDKTSFEPLKEKAKEAISITMKEYPNWKWTNGIKQEYARMILPLAWLVRIEDTKQHREWLDLIVNKLLEDLDSCGAIMEKLGPKGMGRYDKIASNEEYGTKEAPLISNYGDKVTDLLYTLNYSVFSLQEAAAATSNLQYTNALNKIVDFLVKVQVKSQDHPDLNGSWFRAFDYGKWEYWASNADSGWGPWGTQTGWTQSWILNGLIFYQKSQNFWDLTKEKYSTDHFKNLAENRIKTMLKYK